MIEVIQGPNFMVLYGRSVIDLAIARRVARQRAFADRNRPALSLTKNVRYRRKTVGIELWVDAENHENRFVTLRVVPEQPISRIETRSRNDGRCVWFDH